MYKRQNLSKDALRNLVGSDNTELHSIASSSLAALNDLSTLNKIDGLVKSGKIQTIEAINVFSLANPDFGGQFISPYLTAQDSNVQEYAIEYLGSIDSFQNVVRDEVFANNDALTSSRLVASKVLSAYDSNFQGYALDVFALSETNLEVKQSILTGVTSNYIATGFTSDPERAELQRAISSYLLNDEVSQSSKAVVANLQRQVFDDEIPF